jgi:DNA-binding GntR family transcriptional regulator
VTYRLQAKSGAAAAAVGRTRRAYQGIRSLMLHNEIAPGQKISYRELAERLGMSQTPVIQALKWLEFQQLVRHEPNRGYFTAPVDAREVAEIYDLRVLIEPALLPRVVAGLDAAKLKRLRAALEAHRNAAREVFLAERLEKDMAFHLTLADLAGHAAHRKILGDLFDLLYLKYSGSVLFAAALNAADDDHQKLYESLARKDLKQARATLTRHIRRVKRHVLEGLQKIDAAKSKAGI